MNQNGLDLSSKVVKDSHTSLDIAFESDYVRWKRNLEIVPETGNKYAIYFH